MDLNDQQAGNGDKLNVMLVVKPSIFPLPIFSWALLIIERVFNHMLRNRLKMPTEILHFEMSMKFSLKKDSPTNIRISLFFGYKHCDSYQRKREDRDTSNLLSI